MQNDYRTIGHSTRRVGATGRVKGLPVFSADLELDRPLVLRVLRSRHAHARLKAIDTSAAADVTGVVRVFTAADIPGKNRLGIINKDQPLLAEDKVRSLADPVALVAALTDEAAERALASIAVTYEELPAVFSPEEALRPDAPPIHSKGNLMFTRKVVKGDPENCWADCAAVVETTYTTPQIEHSYLEPDAGAGLVDDAGVLVIYASTQNPHYDHKEVVGLLGLADDRVRIIQAATGGGFGSKLDLNVQGFIGLALHHLQRPVKMVYSREESFLATAKRHPLTMTVKTGADRNGRLMALHMDITCDTGAYGSYGIAVAGRSAVLATGPYQVPNVRVTSRCVYTNNPFCGAMRGFGTPQVAVAHESQMDLLAEKLGLDPFEIRRRNAFTENAETATGQILTHSVGIGECLAAIKPYYDDARAHWRLEESDPYRRRGIGIGCMWYGIGNTGVQNPSTARIELGLDGQVTLFSGCADIGQGSSTVLKQIAAETLGLDTGALNLVTADTGLTTNAGATSASRQTYISGNAVMDAAAKLVDVLLTEAVNRLKLPKSELMLENGFVRAVGSPDQKVSFRQLADRIRKKGLPLSWSGYFDPETVPLDPETGRGVPYATYAFAAQLALVSVDTLTGETSVNKIVAAHDVGRAIHPENVIGQICGGVAMGLGFALMEEFIPGSTLSLKDYHIPTCADIPEIIPIIVESPEPSGPFGAKGVGEPALIPTAPAILNAIADALDRRITSLPASLERVLETCIKAGHFGPKEVENA